MSDIEHSTPPEPETDIKLDPGEILTPYEAMITERLDDLKTQFEEFAKENTDDPAEHLPSFIMLHVAQLYTRLDIMLDQLESGKPKEETS